MGQNEREARHIMVFFKTEILSFKNKNKNAS